ncbi:MAG TPA: M43 family zinc metalloprotease [Verrucomicrobiae bacterium]|nr:M43 family zinc metalloprotease [Verrucomicrobiae bacterium]
MASTLLIALAIFGAVNTAPAQLQWRLSAKYFSDAFGNLPTAGQGLGSRVELTNHVNAANALLQRAGRGYQIVLTEVVTLRGLSQWFDLDARSQANKQALETEAVGNPSLYLWRPEAINVYINDSSSGYCSGPSSGNLIFLGQQQAGGSNGVPTLLHEIGHFFNLCHTHGCQCGDCGPDFDCDAGTRSDEVPDTLQDSACWIRDQVAVNNFNGRHYDQLNDGQRAEVDLTYQNVMSYHADTALPDYLLTEDQLDRMTDASNGDRINVANGRTWFVDDKCIGLFRNGTSQCGTFSGPFSELPDGISSAQTGDILLMRTGTYTVRPNVPITKPMTLRASRGAATIFGLVVDLGGGFP